MDNKLVKAQSGQIEISKSSPKALNGISVVKCLDLAAKMTGYKELSAAESDLWLELLTPYSASEIEKAFKAHLAVAEFFPKPVQILELLNAGALESRAQRDADRTAAILEENRQIREQLKSDGQPFGIEQYQGIMRQALEMVKRIPAPEPGRRSRLKKRLSEFKKRA